MARPNRPEALPKGEGSKHQADPDPATPDAADEKAPDTLHAVIAAQRWDIAGLKEQLREAEAARAEADAVHHRTREGQAAEIATLRQALAEAERAAHAAAAQAAIHRGLFERLHDAVFRQLWAEFPRPAAGADLFRAMVTVWQSGLFDDAYYRSQCTDDEIPARMPALVHYLLHGERLGRDPHPLFDGRHYRSQLAPDEAPDNALLHYLQKGGRLAPNPLFEVEHYLAQHAELADATINPLVHYLAVGSGAGSSPHPLFDPAHYTARLAAYGIERPAEPLAHYLSAAVSMASPHPFFDAGFYLSSHPETGASGVAPLVHYLAAGERLGWKPHRWFDPTHYRAANPDIADAGTNALIHFVTVGAEQGRSPSSAFDFAFYRRQCGTAGAEQSGYRLFLDFLETGVAAGRSPHPLVEVPFIARQLGGGALDPDGLWQLLAARRVSLRRALTITHTPERVLAPHWLLDPEYFESRAPAAVAHPEGPLLFYLSRGWRGDDPPHPLFDPVYYRKQAAQRGIAVGDPLAHFVETGSALGLNPHPLFDAAYYLRANPDLDAGTNPLQHYLTLGEREGRNPHPLFCVAEYRTAAALEPESDCLIHYLRHGGAAGIDPHPLFDTSYYLSQLKAGLPAGTTPLVHYLTDPAGMQASPHPLFDPDHFRAQLAAPIPDGTAPLVHYLTLPPAQAPLPHPAFDAAFFEDGRDRAAEPAPALAAYLAAWRRAHRQGVPLQRLRLREANRDFCSLSYLLDHPRLFDSGEVPLIHFLRHAGPPSGTGTRRGKTDPAASAGTIGERFRPAAADPEALRAAARAQLDRGLAYLDSGDPLFRLSAAAWADGFAALGRAAAPRATVAGDDPALLRRVKTAQRVALYVIDAPDTEPKAYHRAMLAALDAAGYPTIAIGGSAEAAALAQVADVAAGAIARSGAGEFAAWIVALVHLAPALAEIDHVLLLNDGLVGPFGALTPLLRSLENHPADFLALTESWEVARHWQGGLLRLSRHALFSGAFLNFLLALADTLAERKPSRAAAQHDEIRLTRQLADAGVVAAPWRPYADAEAAWLASLPERLADAQSLPERLEEQQLDGLIGRKLAPRFADYLGEWLIERSAFLRAGERVDPLHFFWDSLFDPREFPFIARELLLTNPSAVPTLIGLPALLLRHGRKPDAALLRDLLPPERPGTTPAYFRLSPGLIAGLCPDRPGR